MQARWFGIVAAACTACSTTAAHVDRADADEDDAGTVDTAEGGHTTPSDGAIDDADEDIAIDQANDEGTDAADESGRCSDGSIYVPDADDSTACSASHPCTGSLICAGLGCDERWECLPHYQRHPCPVELVPYCGCDGVTFLAPSGCVDRPYLRIGACDDGANCDLTDLRCTEEEPDCAAGTLASIVDGAYGACVPFASCRCEFIWECPHREKYACNRTTWRCGALPVP